MFLQNALMACKMLDLPDAFAPTNTVKRSSFTRTSRRLLKFFTDTSLIIAWPPGVHLTPRRQR